jgi:predicted nucleotide-binding protein (sugar kinase/HSP70/actin superfamily)
LMKGCRLYISQLLKEKYDEVVFQNAFEAALKAKAEFSQTLHDKAVHTLQKAKEENRFVILLAGRPYHNDPLVQHKVSEIITSFGVDVITEDIIRGDSEEVKDAHIIPQWSYMNRIMRAAHWVATTDEPVHFVQLTSFGCGPDAFVVDEVSDLLKRGGKNLTLLKVDDVNNAGSLRLRIRSLIESLKFKSDVNGENVKFEFKTTPAYTEADRGRKILCTYFSEFHSPFIPPLFKLMGYEVENLPPSNADSAKYGLTYANNEVCYPATLVVGDCIRALQSGKYDRNKITFAITQTGGQCRATNYIALIKKALLAAGYGDIPVISVSIMNTINDQPGFKPDLKKAFKVTLYMLFYADAIAKMYYASAVREKEAGAATALKEEYLKRGVEAIEQKKTKEMLRLLEEAAKR